MTRTIRILCIALLTLVGLVGSSLPATRGNTDAREIFTGRKTICASPSRSTANTADRPKNAVMNSKT